MLNRAKWEAKGPDSYTFEYQRSYCECSPAMLERVRITVVDGQVTTVVSAATGDTVAPPAFRFTIDSLFEDLERVRADGPYRITVTYDPTLGYPTAVVADLDETLVDDDWGFYVQRLTTL